MAEPGLVISHLFDRPGPRLRRLANEAPVWSLRNSREPAWLAGREHRRSFHWGLGPVLADFKSEFIRQGLDRFLAERRVENFSFDLGPAARRHLSILPLSTPLGPSAIRRLTESALNLIRRHYSGPLAAENYNFYSTGLYRHITEPGFIRDYLAEFDLGLVLDLAHGAVTAHNTERTPENYFADLPLERVSEIHVSRPWLPPSSTLPAADAHQAPAEREWGWLKGLINCGRLPGGVAVFVEYYGDLGKLIKAQSYLNGLLPEGNRPIRPQPGYCPAGQLY